MQRVLRVLTVRNTVLQWGFRRPNWLTELKQNTYLDQESSRMPQRLRLTLFLFIISVTAVLWPGFADGQTVALQVAPSKRNLELEKRLKAALAGSAGDWGVSVKHVERNEVAGINSDQEFQMASVFKIPVLVELFYQVSEGKISLDERVEWTNPERYFGSGVLVSLTPGLRPTIGDLATLMIIISDNAATDYLGARLGPQPGCGEAVRATHRSAVPRDPVAARERAELAEPRVPPRHVVLRLR